MKNKYVSKWGDQQELRAVSGCDGLEAKAPLPSKLSALKLNCLKQLEFLLAPEILKVKKKEYGLPATMIKKSLVDHSF